jgi:hypothetical protein
MPAEEVTATALPKRRGTIVALLGVDFEPAELQDLFTEVIRA